MVYWCFGAWFGKELKDHQEGEILGRAGDLVFFYWFLKEGVDVGVGMGVGVSTSTSTSTSTILPTCSHPHPSTDNLILSILCCKPNSVGCCQRNGCIKLLQDVLITPIVFVLTFGILLPFSFVGCVLCAMFLVDPNSEFVRQSRTRYDIKAPRLNVKFVFESN